MASVIATGNTATLTFGTTSYSVSLIKLTPRGRERGKIETSHLGTVTHKKYEAGGLAEPGGFDCDYIFDPDTSLATSLAEDGIKTAAEEITITFPKGSNTNGATLAGSGFIDAETPPELNNEDLMVGSFGVQWTGGAADEPEYTNAS